MPQYRRKLKVMDLIRGSLNLEKQMAWVFAQVFLAFAVAVFIVWWTFPKAKKPKPPMPPDARANEDKTR